MNSLVVVTLILVSVAFIVQSITTMRMARDRDKWHRLAISLMEKTGRPVG